MSFIQSRFESHADSVERERFDRLIRKKSIIKFGNSFLDAATHGIFKNDLILLGGKSGCLHGTSIVNFHRTGRGFKLRIEEAYKRFNNICKGNQKWDKKFPTYIRSYNGKTIQLHEVEDIIYSGEKRVFKLELDNGLILRATPDHEIKTKSGWVRMDKLNKKYKVMCDTLKPFSHKAKKNRPWDFLTRVLIYHPYARGTRKEMETHRCLYESHINGISFDKYKSILRNDKEKAETLMFIDPKVFAIHHKNFDHFDNRPENMIHIEHNKHKKLHTVHTKYNFNQGIPQYSRVKSVGYVCVAKTYDIKCKAPHHNFVANGMVVHNCGKTEIASIIAQTCAIKHKVFYFALEAERKEIVRRNKFRILAQLYYSKSFSEPLYFDKWYCGEQDNLVEHIEGQANEIIKQKEKNFYTLYRDSKFTIKDLEKEIVQIQSEANLIIVDHLHYIDIDDPDSNRAMKDVVVRLNDLVRDLGVPVILIAHIRKGERKLKQIVPDMEDFKGSSDIFQNATKIITFASAREFSGETNAALHPTIFYVNKCRFAGGVTRYAGVLRYNIKTNNYEPSFEIGYLRYQNTEYEPICEKKELPYWCKGYKVRFNVENDTREMFDNDEKSD